MGETEEHNPENDYCPGCGFADCLLPSKSCGCGTMLSDIRRNPERVWSKIEMIQIMRRSGMLSDEELDRINTGATDSNRMTKKLFEAKMFDRK